jgi:uncharacterized protein YkwD
MSGLVPRVLVAAIVAAALPACSGGGSSSTAGGPPPTPAPTSQASATPLPSAPPTATPTPAALQYTGRVVDADHGNAPVAGAFVSVGTSFGYVAGSGYVLTGTTATTTTANDGTFSITGTGAPSYIQVTASGLVAAHRPLPSAPAIAVSTFNLPTATADELAGLAELNSNRSKHGSGQGALPLSLDADMEMSARAHAVDEAVKGYYGHVAPGDPYSFSIHFVAAVGGFSANPYFVQENLDSTPSGLGDLAFADDAYIAQGPADGHFQNVVSKTNLWVGFGEALNGKPDPASSTFTSENYFVENFITSTANPSP